MIRFVSSALVLSMALLLSVPAHANSGELLDFLGLGDSQSAANFYDGGGLPGTPNYGVTFSSNFFGLQANSVGGSGNFLPTITTNLGQTLNIPAALFICPGGPPLCGGSQTTGVMNVANGFSTGINLYYSSFSNTLGTTWTVTLWSGANGTGTVLATMVLGNNNPMGSCAGLPLFCHWSVADTSFTGTARSVTFSGPPNELGIADITIGSSQTAIPEPGSLYLLGTGLAAISLGKIRRFFGV